MIIVIVDKRGLFIQIEVKIIILLQQVLTT